MLHTALQSIVAGVLALASATLPQKTAAPGREKLARIDEARAPVVFEGSVFAPDGVPAEGAVVVSSAGGKAVVDAKGRYRLEAQVPRDAERVQVTAVASAGQNLVASASVAVSATTDAVGVDPLALAQGGTCSPAWLPTFGGKPGTDDEVTALAVYDDGSGPALYVSGQFMAAGGVAVNRIARWNGASWSALGSGVSGSYGLVYAMAVFDDGGGPALYAGGGFTTAGGVATSCIARWDGTSWSALGSGVAGTVHALAVYDDGGGPALYAGGFFTTAGGVAANDIARWNGSSWSALGTGTSGEIRALAVYDDGRGAALYAGGVFASAGGGAANRIARWDGSSWSVLGNGVNGPNSIVHALAVYDDGAGADLYAGGSFTSAGGVATKNIARWDGSSWSALGSGVNSGLNNIPVRTLAVYDDGGGPALYAGGNFTTAGGASYIARWNGASWSAVGSGAVYVVNALAVYDDGSGPQLCVGGQLETAGGVAVSGIARWNGSSWSALGSGLNSSVLALAVFDDGDGPELYAAGTFTTAGGVTANRIARWDGSSWSALGSGLNSSVLALAVFDDGDGPELYAAGTFVTAGGVTANRIARWDGSSWSTLGSGLNAGALALAVYDDGGGPELYAAGDFTTAGDVETNRIAKWDGSSWSLLDSSSLASGMDDRVAALVVYDDGLGPALYAGGDFTTAGLAAANRIARWDGSSWSVLGSGMNGSVLALAVHDAGGGPALYVGGSFTTAGGSAAMNIARWNGSDWSALGGGTNGTVRALAEHDDGSGPALHAGGDFTTAGGAATNKIARWDGSDWNALGSGMNEAVYALVVHDGGGGRALYAGGAFASAIDSHDSFLAKWGCPDTTPPALSHPASITVLDGFPDGPGEIVTFSVFASDDSDPTPDVSCVPPSGSFFPRGTTMVECTATDASGNESTSQFPVTVRAKARRL